MKKNDSKTYLRQVRLKMGLSQVEMAALLDVSVHSVVSIEAGRMRLTENRRARLNVLANRDGDLSRTLKIEKMVNRYRRELEQLV